MGPLVADSTQEVARAGGAMAVVSKTGDGRWRFVNTDAKDEKIVFVEERGQPRPATEEEIVRIAEPA